MELIFIIVNVGQNVDAVSAVVENTSSSTYLTPTTPLGPKPVLFMPYMNIEATNQLVSGRFQFINYTLLSLDITKVYGLKMINLFQRMDNVNNSAGNSGDPSSTFFTTIRYYIYLIKVNHSFQHF